MGSGGIGGYYGAMLQNGGADVTFIARGATLDALRQNGVQLEGVKPLNLAKVTATDNPETIGKVDDKGVLWPSVTALYSAMALQSELNGRMLETIRELTGSAMITLPSSLKDFENPETAGDVERYMRSASSDAKSKVALMRLAWDFIGSEFGSRHQQYEKFYGGASFIVKQNVYRNFDFKRATGLVDAALNLPPISE